MATTQLWIKKTVKDLHLAPGEARYPAVKEFRLQIERSRLLEAMHTTYDSINNEAGAAILLELLYLQPQFALCKYTFERPGVDYEMQLVLPADGPTLVFSLHRTNETAGVPAIQIVHRFFMHPSQRAVRHKLRINPSMVTNIDLREWFTYLLSGFRNSRKPLAKKFSPTRTD